MSSLNKVMLIGNLGADPEIRHTQDGRPIANFSMATSESWRDKNTGERKERTEWHRIVIFSEGLCKVAEQYLKKGSKVYVEGQLATRKWQDQQGIDRYTTEIVLQGFGAKLVMLDRAESSGYRPGGDGPQDFGMDPDRASASPTGNAYAQATRGGGWHQQHQPSQQDIIDDEIPF